METRRNLGGWLREGQSKLARLASPVANAKPQRGRREREGLRFVARQFLTQRHGDTKAQRDEGSFHAEPQSAQRDLGIGFAKNNRLFCF